MSENGDKKTGHKTDKKLFEVGGPPGPGRGNSRQRQEIAEIIESIKELSQDKGTSLLDPEVLDTIGRLILYNTVDADKRTRLDFMKQFLSWVPRRVEAEARERERENILDSGETERIREALQARQLIDIQGVDDIADFHCPHCGKKFSAADEVEK